jgi:hypothetical protein
MRALYIKPGHEAFCLKYEMDPGINLENILISSGQLVSSEKWRI